MPQRLALVLAAAIVTTCLGGCASGLPEDVAKLGYVDRVNRLAMNTPPGWQVRELTGLAPVIVSKPGGPPGAARPCITVDVIPGLGSESLEMLARSSLARLASVPGFLLVREDPTTTAAGQKAWTVTFELAPAGAPIKERQMLLMAGDKVYVVTAAAAADAFDAEAPNFDICFGSLRAGW